MDSVDKLCLAGTRWSSMGHVEGMHIQYGITGTNMESYEVERNTMKLHGIGVAQKSRDI